MLLRGVRWLPFDDPATGKSIILPSSGHGRIDELDRNNNSQRSSYR
jgi:hypothetical protein